MTTREKLQASITSELVEAFRDMSAEDRRRGLAAFAAAGDAFLKSLEKAPAPDFEHVSSEVAPDGRVTVTFRTSDPATIAAFQPNDDCEMTEQSWKDACSRALGGRAHEAFYGGFNPDQLACVQVWDPRGIKGSAVMPVKEAALKPFAELVTIIRASATAFDHRGFR